MDKVLVTGGTGFVGHWMHKTQPPKLSVAYIGRKEYELYHWQWMAWDYIVHLANISPVEVLNYGQDFACRILYASSGIVYHEENDTEYRQNKIEWEKECIDSRLDVVIARLFTFYGAYLTDDHAAMAFKKAGRAGKPLTIWGDGKAVRSYMSGRAMGNWLWTILFCGEKGEAYDVGDDKPVTILELARMTQDIYHVPIVILNTQPDPMPVYLPVDTVKTKRLDRLTS